MLLFKRLSWLLLLVLVAALAISTIKCTEEKVVVEELPIEEQFDDPEVGYEYENPESIEFEGGDYSPAAKEYLSGPPPLNYSPPPPPPYPQQQPYPVQQQPYLPPPPPPPPVQPVQPNYAPQQPYLPPTVGYESSVPYGGAAQYQPVPLPIPALNYSVPIEISTPTVYLDRNQYSAPANYVQPIAPVYSPPPPPPQPQVVYPAQQQVNYQSPQISYQTVQLSYPTPPVASYQQTPPVSSYAQTPQVSSYAQTPQVSSYVETPQVGYQQTPQVSYQAPQVNYQQQQVIKQNNYAPVYPPALKYTPVVLVKSNYSQPQQPVANYRGGLLQPYSLLDVVPFISPIGYRANHPSLYYYRSQIQLKHCPRGPIYKFNYADLDAAFAYAQAQLGQFTRTSGGLQYLNSSQPTFAARHQIFSFLSQQSARMDEEGLLMELVSQYIADRACLTKWDRQRYLPQLTKLVSTQHFPGTHSCSNYYGLSQWSQQASRNCYASKYRTFDGFCNNPYHPYWGKSNVCHIRLLSPDYADGISLPRNSYNARYPLPNPRALSNLIHHDLPIEGPYNLLKMQWGQFINHDITNTALSSYDGLVDCCKQPQTRGCWPIYVPPGDKFFGQYNVTCLNFIRSGVCPTCQLGPRQQFNKNTAFLDLSHIYGNNLEVANQLRTFRLGQLRTSSGRNGEVLLPVATSQDQCSGVCFQAGDSRVNQHPTLTALHLLLLRNHNRHAAALALRHPTWNDELLYQEARRINIAEYQMITYGEYFPIVFGPILSAYYRLLPGRGLGAYTAWDPKADPSTWNEYATATCRFGHSQISSTFGLYARIFAYGQQQQQQQPNFRLKEWFMRPSLLSEGLLVPMLNGLMGKPAEAVDPWITNDVRNHLYQSHKERFGGDLAATNVWRGRDHGLPGYVHYVEYCFNYRVRGWKDLGLFIPPHALNQMRRLYRVVENIDLFTGGMAERHFPGADIGPTFACVNGIQYNHLKFGDRFYFEHGGQAGSFTPVQLEEIRRATLARLICRTSAVQQVPQYAFLQPSIYNPLLDCSQLGDIDYNKF